MNSSSERGSFRIESIIKRVEEGTKTAEAAEEEIDLYKSWDKQKEELEATDEWKVDNMEYDLRSTQWICNKAKASEVYAQNLYAAMCNNEFTKNDVWPILTGKRWGCSWRYAGGIIADMIEEGDYIDWYCSGIGDGLGNGDQDGSKGYVGEGTVTEQIKADLFALGWILVTDHDS